MKSSATHYPLLRAVDDFEAKNHHSFVLYDDPKYGLLIRNRFVENGLNKDETCVCITHEEVSKVENELASTGIDVDHFNQKNKLYVYHTENIMERKGNVIAGFNDLLTKLTSDAKPPYRFVGRVIHDISTYKGMDTELNIENLFHSHFDKYDCSFLCTYGVDDIEKTNRSFWIQKLLENHHNLIYATEPQKAVAFESELLT
jgi:hypothetical protein